MPISSRRLLATGVGLGLLATGCGLIPNDSTQSTGPVVLGFINGGTTSFHTCLQTAVTRTTSDNLAKVLTANSNGSKSTELRNVKDMIARKVDAIVLLSVDASALGADIAAAHKAKTPITLIALTPSDDSEILGAVISDLPGIGKLDAQWVDDDADGKPAEAVVVSGDGSTSSNLMVGGFTKNLAGNVRVVGNERGMFDRATAKAAAAGLIKAHPDIRYAFVANEDMAFGVREAFDAAGAESVKIVTVNGTDPGLAALKDGKFAATVSNSVQDLGALAVTHTLSLLRKDEKTKIAHIDARLVTKDNADTAPVYCDTDS
ncbi:substrate-binding domain-containing protein [Streptomyces sp. MBT62]|uniref:sugar ABC transporter substrate-binding protein n=1 Tax=Streptomyces sp. MBT62 TaxID=2800410 RepID=UPI00190A58D7|nr:substrate-binding domain-containing protein [Streptomyces sp. MBT62]MBK3565752.1 substrate-binding domain-containing protein [Streptomyces sp. MBT62]